MKTRPVNWDFAIPEVGTGAAETAELFMDEETFAGFYQRTARPLWAYLARVSGNAALADDLLQESYLRMLGAGNPRYGDVACRRYLFRIATNLLRDHWRRPAPAPLEEIPEGVWAADNHDFGHIDSKARLAPAMARMRPRDRQLLWLAYAEGYSHREIAEITGLGATSIRLLLFRARRKLAGMLKQPSPASGRES